MSRNRLHFLPRGLLVLLLAPAAQAQLPWSAQTHDIALGDFNGDGRTDLLFVGRSASASNGIAFSNTAGPYDISQTWPGNFLGIDWQSGFRPVVGDFNGDGRGDVFLQRRTRGDHYLLLANAAGRLTAINQTVPWNQGGHDWSAGAHRVVCGDFDGDSRADLFLQSVAPSGLNAVFLAGADGSFSRAQQTWRNVHLGFKWSAQNAVVHAGDFTGDGRADLFVQARPDVNLVDLDFTTAVPVYPPGRFGIVSAKPANANGELFYTPAHQIWSRRYQGADWSAANYHAVVGDFSGDGKADILLQGRRAGSSNAEFVVSSAGQVVSGNVLTDRVLLEATGDLYRLYAANFDGAGGAGVYLQALDSAGTSAIAWNNPLGAWSERYQYDALGRLRRVTFANGSVTDYALDRAGNRTARSTIVP